MTWHYQCYCHVKRAEGVSVDNISGYLCRLAGHLQDTLHQPLILSPRDVCECIALWQTTVWLTDTYRDQRADSSKSQPILHCLSCRANSCYWTRSYFCADRADRIRENEVDWGMRHVRWRREMHTEFWWEIRWDWNRSEDLGLHEKIILRRDLK